MVISKEGETRNITIENFAYIPELTDYLFSGTYALQKGLHMRNEDKTMVLFKDKLTIKFDQIVNKRSSFIMCLKILAKLENGGEIYFFAGYADNHSADVFCMFNMRTLKKT